MQRNEKTGFVSNECAAKKQGDTYELAIWMHTREQRLRRRCRARNVRTISRLGPPMASQESAAHLEQLIARCAAGEAAALQLLYQNTAAQLFGVLKRILVRADLAEEALQDVYVSIWRNAKEYRTSKGAVFTWMTSIARYRAIDIKRSRRREVSFADPSEYVREDVDVTADLANVAGLDADVERLKRCLGELGTMQRNAVCLAYMNGLSHDEVATALGSPLGTVKSWVRRGLDALKGCLGL
jgi:RNA polymerase sigma-70 factor (ECF subfamily)